MESKKSTVYPYYFYHIRRRDIPRTLQSVRLYSTRRHGPCITGDTITTGNDTFVIVTIIGVTIDGKGVTGTTW